MADGCEVSESQQYELYRQTVLPIFIAHLRCYIKIQDAYSMMADNLDLVNQVDQIKDDLDPKSLETVSNCVYYPPFPIQDLRAPKYRLTPKSAQITLLIYLHRMLIWPS
ncbi:hypothetical protein RF11_01693 [Thelohanellus kitauei]|uniref:Uncharacterized protein n=1 Tax=Thelohanellus kitauei TaxID=669202 RepID=A0A0C2NER9_THEKT|nr:hypothetical protein RF11_01693 [Thelohanellus kitauei]